MFCLPLPTLTWVPSRAILAPMVITLKQLPELRHVLAHLMLALEELAEGDSKAALYELRQCRGMLLWKGDADFRRWVKKEGLMRYKKKPRPRPKPCRG